MSPLRKIYAVAAALVAIASGRLVGADASDERFAALEKRLDALAAENIVLRRRLGEPDAKPAAVAVVPAGKEAALSIGGFTQTHFESGTAPDARYVGLGNRFLLRRARLAATGTFAENVAFKLEGDFGNNSISARTGAAGQLTDAYVAWTRFPAASVRLGQFKTPFGFEQLTSDTKTATVERALPNDRLTLGRQIGATAFGALAGQRVNYSLGAFNGTGTNNGGNDNQKFLWAGRISAVAFDGKVAGHRISFTTAANAFTTVDQGAFTGRRIGRGVDAQLALGSAEVQAEWLRNDQHPFAGRPTAAAGWALLGKFDLSRQWQGVLRFENYDSNTATANTTTDLWTYGLNYRLKGEDLKLSFNYLVGRPPSPAPHGGRFLGRVQVLF